MSFLSGFGLGRRQHGSSEFVTTIDHDTPFRLGFTPSEDDVRYMARLRNDKVRARLFGIPFDYPICPYTFSLANYFIRGLEMDHETPNASAFMMIAPPSPDRGNLFSLCFSDETTDYGVDIEPTDMIDGAVPHDEYRDEMDMLGVSIIKIAEEDQTVPAPKLPVFVVPTTDDMYESTVGPVEGASNSMDPPISFDILSGFVTHSDYVYDDSVMDLRIYEYLSVSYDDDDETVDFGTDDQLRELKIGLSLSIDERDRLIPLLKSYLDVFAWSYEDVPGLDPSMVQHHLLILPHARSVKQKLRQLHPQWLANVVLVPKKDSKVRVCVDFRDLNKANLKDDFPLLHIDLLVDSTGESQSMLSFMDGFSGYNQILMALDDMEKTTFITEWGTYCYKVMLFGDVEVYVDDMIVKSQGRVDHLAALEIFFEMIRKFRFRLNPKKCTFGVTSGKLLGHIVSEQGIEVDPDKIKAILDMPVSRIDKEIRGFLGRLQYINRFITRLTNILPPMLGRPLFLYLSVSDMALGCMLAQLDDSGKERAIYYLSKRMLEYEIRYVMIEHFCLALVWATRRLMRWLVLLIEFDIQYVSHKSIKEGVVVDHLVSLPTIKSKSVDDDFPNEEFVAMTRDHIRVCITQMDVLGDSNLVLRQVQGDWKTRDAKLKPYHAYLELLIEKFEELKYIHLLRAHNQFVDALATLTSTVDVPTNAIVHPLLIETRTTPIFYHLIDETEVQDDLPWFHDIHQFLRSSTYPEVMTAKDRRALRQLATRFVICRETLYRQSVDGMLLLCLDRTSVDRVIREIHAGMLECQMHGDLIHILLSELHVLTSPWPFSVWGIDIIGKIWPKSSNGHEFILVAIDYFTKWVEAASYAKLTSTRVASFIKSPLFAAMEFHMIETEMGSLRVVLEQQISETEWAQARFDQLNLLDERRLRAADHVQAYHRKMARVFGKRVKP
ncbi:Retrovirus-related Pol polyprotein from transposon 297 [Vitis vinifera]|uniref:Retrovirus-related Pol polyprotein from transposon 297 n=1 Tax=Vitis vinifera TaxID=29760 RepID=A0A438DG79_VITVI|nr:Retrovirus-related Pol polyprotein from transposon 297 [Vitis vinifera]